MKHHTTASIGELCHVSIGRTPRRSESRYWNGPHPWATIRDLDGQTLKFTKQGITDAALKEVMPKPVEPGTLLFSFKLTIGKVAFAGCKLHHNEAIAALPIRDPTVLDRDFLFHALQIKTHDSNANHAVLGKVLNKRKIEELEIPLPPIDEQQRIASILNRAARIERLRARAADRLREFVPALFIKMFGDPVENPMGWPVARLGDACTIIGGGTPRRNNSTYFGGAILWATPTDVTTLNDIFIGHTAETITEIGLKKSSARLVPEGTVLMTSRATIGYTAIAAKPMATNQGFANLICGEHLIPEYLSFWLSGQRNRLIQLAGGTTFKEIPKSTLKGVLIPLPPLALQSWYARLLQSIRHAAATAETASKTASTLSASLMARLLGNER